MKRSLALAIAVVVLAGAGYWAFASWQTRTQKAAISAALADGTAALRDGLAGDPAEAAKRVDGALERLHATRASRQRELAESTEVYLVGARAVLLRKADAARLRGEAEAARRQLVAHMSTPRGRNDSWIRQAAELKKRMDQAYFDWNTSLQALAELLRGLPESPERDAAIQAADQELKRADSERSSAASLIVR